MIDTTFDYQEALMEELAKKATPPEEGMVRNKKSKLLNRLILDETFLVVAREYDARIVSGSYTQTCNKYGQKIHAHYLLRLVAFLYCKEYNLYKSMNKHLLETKINSKLFLEYDVIVYHSENLYENYIKFIEDIIRDNELDKDL